MKFREFESEAEELLTAALRSLGYSEQAGVGPSANPGFGDLSSTVALKIAKTTKEKPGDVARKIVVKLLDSSAPRTYVGAVDAHPSGYINIKLDQSRFTFDALSEALAGRTLGTVEVGEGKTMAVEHTNVNPNKALHIGHARNLVLGDSLARLMRHHGYSVQVLNYIDDSGAQVADIIVGFRFLGLSDAPPEGTKFDSYCGDSVYGKVNQEYAKNPSLKERQSTVLREIERGTGEIAEYTRGIVSRILGDELLTCWRLGASYDLLNWESQLVHSGMWASVFEEMKRRKMCHYETEGENKGCWVIPDPDTGEQKVLVRSDGTAVYVAKDIPYAAWKVGLVADPFGYSVYRKEQPGSGATLWSTSVEGEKEHPHFGGADVAVSVIDTRQSYLQRIVSRVLEGIKEGSGERYRHRGYEVVALSKKTAAHLGVEVEGEFAHMSGRKGIYVNVDTMLDALKAKAIEETRKRNPEESAEWVDDVSEALAVAALRYELVKQDPDKMIVFDLDDSLRFEGDTGPYLLYTYARAMRILQRSDAKPELTPAGAAKLAKRQERELVRRLSSLDKAVMTAGEYLSPKEIARYSHGLAVAFNDFYERIPVNKEEDQELRGARLALVEAFGRTFAQALELIGVPRRDRI